MTSTTSHVSESAVVKRTGNRYLYLVVFTSGMTTLAVELTASRLLGSIFGTSNIVWANVIGLMLLYLTIGYFLGGRLADRYPHHRTLLNIITWGAFLSALIPLLSRPVLLAAASAVAGINASLALGSFIAVLLLFSVPVTLLGMVSPFAIRLAIHDPAKAGRISGQIYAISTLGSLVGTFLPVLVVVPLLGTYQTFLLFGGILFLVAWIGLWLHIGSAALRWLWMPLVVIVLALLVLNGPLRPAFSGAVLLYEDETPYNYIQVQEDTAGYRYLYLNEGQGVHSIYHPNDLQYNGTWDYFLTAPYFNPDFSPDEMESLLVIGLAAGTIPRQHIAVYGDIPMAGIEIDPGIIAAGADYFDMNAEMMPNLDIYAEDGRFILNQLDEQYTVVAIDAYRPPYIPWHLTTVEFFQQVRAHLADNGVVAINVGRTPEDRRLVDALSRVLSEVYADVYAIDVPRSFNTILIGTLQPTHATNLEDNLARLDAIQYPMLHEILTNATAAQVPVVLSDTLFTDNRAPVEILADSLVLNFLLFGDVTQVR